MPKVHLSDPLLLALPLYVFAEQGVKIFGFGNGADALVLALFRLIGSQEIHITFANQAHKQRFAKAYILDAI